MPALPSLLLQDTLISRSANATDATSDALQVVCAWPVSGQYGPGSRGLYYVLIIACVFARKSEWLRNACLAAVLLFPAVAALHGIVLAAVHVDGAVDMDVYGAFQLCSIGILAAPVVVRRSTTYFFDPGRNTIFLWTGLIFAGLLSLTVEFFRLQGTACTQDDYGNPFFPDLNNFPYGATLCGLRCSVGNGPVSPMRGGSANDIYVIPVPTQLTFGTVTLLAAACCIPAILSMVSMWNTILKMNWKFRYGAQTEGEQIDEPIAGTNGATIREMWKINNLIKSFLGIVEILVFGGAVLAIVISGERNFFSYQVRYQTEPIASIGQWAPIVGAGLAVLGALYLRLASDLEAVKKDQAIQSTSNGNSSTPELGTGLETASVHSAITTVFTTDMRRSLSNGGRGTSAEIEMVHTVSAPARDQGAPMKRSWTTDETGSRSKIFKTLTSVSTYLGTAAPGQFDLSDFKNGKATEWPEVPGEPQRNSMLHITRERYNHEQGGDGSVTPTNVGRLSRAASFTSSVASGFGIEGSSATPTAKSPRRPRASTLSIEPTPFDLHDPHVSSSSATTERRPQQRRDTLEVPAPTHHSVPRTDSPSPQIISMPQGPSSPAIVVSSDDITSSPPSTPSLTIVTSFPPSESPTAPPAPVSPASPESLRSP